jgi:hypothetical protein
MLTLTLTAIGEDAIDEKIRVFLRFLDISKTQVMPPY